MSLRLLSVFLVSMVISGQAFAAEPNFKCEIFRSLDGGTVRGSLSLFGPDPFDQRFELKIAVDGAAERSFDGSAYFAGGNPFTSLDATIQKTLIDVISSSRRPGLKVGDLIVFSNTRTPAESTLVFQLMPSGQIGLLQIGVINVLCI